MTKNSEKKESSNDSRLVYLETSNSFLHETLIRIEQTMNSRFDKIDKKFDEVAKDFKDVHARINALILMVVGSLLSGFIGLAITTYTSLHK